MRRPTITGQLLVRCVTEHDWSIPPEAVVDLAARADLPAVAAAAKFHGVTGCVYRSLGPAVDTEQAAALRSSYCDAVGGHLRALTDLARLAPVLDSVGARWLVVKGPVLAEAIYRQPDLRAYNDLDLVVPRRALGEVLAAVEEAGGGLIDRNWPLLRQLKVGEILLRLHHGTLLDLHWDLLNESTVRAAFRVPMAEMIDRARLVQVGPLRVMTLDPIDTLLHVSLHGCLSGGNRLVWLKDVERAIASDALAWDDVVLRARAWGIGPPVAVTLDRAKRLLRASVPEGVTHALAEGQVWLGLSALADRLSPPERSVGYRSVTRLVSRSTRSDTRSSVAELGRHLFKAFGARNRFSPTPPWPDVDPDSRSSLQHARGAPADRHAFLDGVAESS